jgi:hypothetical protein
MSLKGPLLIYLNSSTRAVDRSPSLPRDAESPLRLQASPETHPAAQALSAIDCKCALVDNCCGCGVQKRLIKMKGCLSFFKDSASPPAHDVLTSPS